MKVIVSRNELQAALLFCSTDDSRFTINSVCIEVQKGKGKPIMITTDGRRLCVIDTLAEQEEHFTASHQIVLRSSFVKAICALSKALGGKLFPWIAFENRPGSKQVFVSLVGNKDVFIEVHDGALVEGQFPNWRQVLPPRSKSLRQPVTDIALNGELMGDFGKAAVLLKAKTPVLQMNLVGKEQQIEVRITQLDNFYGIIMQCRVDESVQYQPEFMKIVDALPPPPTKPKKEPEPPEED